MDRTTILTKPESTRPASLQCVLEEIFFEPSRRAGVPIHVLPGLTPVPRKHEEFERLGGRWWLSAEANMDPCRVAQTHVVPREVLVPLGWLWKGGLRADHLRVLHEITDPAWSLGQPLPPMIPPHPSQRAVDAALVGAIRGAVGVAATLAREASRTAGATVAGLLAAERAAVSAGTTGAWSGYDGDPVLLGGRRVGEDAVVWAVLASWRWR